MNLKYENHYQRNLAVEPLNFFPHFYIRCSRKFVILLVMYISRKIFDFMIVLLLVLAAFAVGWYVDMGKYTTLISTILLFGVPAFYLLWRKPKNTNKTLLASFIFALLFAFPFDFISTYANA